MPLSPRISAIVADAHELMHYAIAGEKHVVADFDIAAEQSAVGENNIIAQLAVVADMRRRHEKIIVADDGRRSGGGAAMDLHIFANNIVIADLKIRLLPLISFVLRRAAEHGAGMNFVADTDFRPAGEIGVRPSRECRF